eukprot:16658-Heterococcus_DN1.PRE.3
MEDISLRQMGAKSCDACLLHKACTCLGSLSTARASYCAGPILMRNWILGSSMISTNSADKALWGFGISAQRIDNGTPVAAKFCC